jgi:DNA invertase Pin-like site-specific DNA recombinase
VPLRSFSVPRRRRAADKVAHWSRVAREALARRDGAIRTMRAEGHSLREIAQAAGLSHTAVRKIILRG